MGIKILVFFNAKASHWQQHNSILGLYNAEGVWQEDDQRVKDIVVDYFTNIFESNGLSDVSLVVNVIKPVVTDVMNTGLTQDFQATEVIKALKQMHPKKSSRTLRYAPYILLALLFFSW